jgi:hypothetical protein
MRPSLKGGAPGTVQRNDRAARMCGAIQMRR